MRGMRWEAPGAGDAPAMVRFRDVRPRAVARCATPRDVAAALAFARREGLEVAVRAGGHCFEGRSSTRGLLIDLRPMDAIDVGDGTVSVGAGVRLGALYDALAARGRTVAGGCGPTVGIAGLALGGGIGLLGRRYGLTCDQLLAAAVVVADGRVVRCDPDHEPDLFWALRGAGGCRFGVVTELTLRTVPAREETCCELAYPPDAAAEVVAAWQRWEAPEEVALSLLVTAPADPRARLAVRVFGLAEAVSLPEPEHATFTRMPYRELKRHLADDDPAAALKPEGGLMYAKSHFFREPLPADTIAALLEHLAEGRVAGQSRELDFTPLGGAYNRVPAGATAFPHRDARFMLKHEVVAEADPDRAWLAESWELARGFGAYVNFPDADLGSWDRAYHGANLERLLRVRERYDPEGVFRRIVVAESDPRWAAAFAAERDRLAPALGGAAIEHIGSTAVPDLPAKPIIDIAVALPEDADVDACVAALAELGYERAPEGDFDGRLFLRRPGHHLSLTARGSDYWIEHLAFRDALRADDGLRRRYGDLKRALAAEHDDPEAYTRAKTALVREALLAAGVRPRSGWAADE
jgi:FAD/FMN-containing dehydrogenase/GrpB-like predicted nucleotidyltransferase (UPF0157 family)